MSLFSGKCDICDCYGDLSDEELSKIKFFASENIVPLRIESQHDLAPYYPYLAVMSGGSKDGRVCYFSHKSFIDIEEHEHLSWMLNDCIKYFKKCKRNKTEYKVEDAVKKMCSSYDDVALAIAERVARDGVKANVNGLHLPMQSIYRNELIKEMVRLGWDVNRANMWVWKKYEWE